MVVVELDHVRASLDGAARGFEGQGGDPPHLVERLRVVKEEVLAGVAEKADCLRRVDADRVAGGNAIEIADLVSVAVALGIEAKNADPREALEPVDAIAVERDMKHVRVLPARGREMDRRNWLRRSSEA